MDEWITSGSQIDVVGKTIPFRTEQVAAMSKPSSRVWLPFSVFACQWLVWGAWQFFVTPRLSAGIAMILLDSIVIKGLVWAAPFVLLFRTGKQRLARSDLFRAPFPWFACVILLCLTAVFLYTVRLSRGLVNTYIMFDPMFVVFSLSAGVIEEFGFRGGLFRMQESAIGFWPAAVINGAMFTLYHYPGILFGGDWTCLLSWRAGMIFVMGVVFCWMFWKWRNLALNMTVHTVWNILSYLFCIAG